MKKLIYILLGLFIVSPLIAQDFPERLTLGQREYSFAGIIDNPALIQYVDKSVSPYGELHFTREPEQFFQCTDNFTIQCKLPVTLQVCNTSYNATILFLKDSRELAYPYLTIQLSDPDEFSLPLLQQVCHTVPVWFQHMNLLQ